MAGPAGLYSAKVSGVVAWLYWTRYVPSLLTKPTKEPQKKTGASLEKLMGYMKPYIIRFGAVLSLVVISSLGEMAIPHYTGRMTDWIMNEDEPEAFTYMSLITVMSAVCEFVCYLIYNITMSRIHTSTQRLGFQSVLKQEIAFFDKAQTAMISVVSQEPVLFARSVKENIKYPAYDATDEEMYRAAELDNAHKFISDLPNGYDTDAGEKGGQVSGGQKQRIAIARALIRQPRILELDDVTSNLDTESEHLVHQALLNDSNPCSVLLIAHKLSTVEKVNHIVILEEGKVLEEGGHVELLEKGGTYADLVNRQNTIYLHYSIGRGKLQRRQLSLKELGKALVRPQIQRRQHIPRTPASAAIVMGIQEDAGAPSVKPTEPTTPISEIAAGSNKKRCDVCGPKDRETQYTYIKFKKYICNTHTVKLCPSYGM
ncbi:uncharacterized protein [Oncorhynchus clarkii lewisi]|uniref:uncharacterized protein n=1 Tax=Oncorhynchus clarkii lewisi TaxID=490388 RepID=UPI0039B8C68E